MTTLGLAGSLLSVLTAISPVAARDTLPSPPAHVSVRARDQPPADTTLGRIVELAPVVVMSTRVERRIEDEPERVEVLAGDDLSEKSETRPGDIATVVREIAGVRLQTTAPATGASGLRIQGLRAEYSAILVDGLPLYGAGAGSAGLGLLQIPPLDLQQVEVIKGTATALYGPSALGGVLDIVTRRPGDSSERTLLVNQTTRGGRDVALWLSRSFGERWGATLLGGNHVQSLTDVNHDGWADLPGYARTEVRPRLFWNGDRGRSLVGTVGAILENREGGGTGDERQHLDTRHGDAGLNARWPLGSAAVVALRGAWSREGLRRREFDPLLGATRVHDHRDTRFGEATYRRAQGTTVWLVGAAYQRDDDRNPDLPGLGERTTVPAALGQITWTVSRWLSASASGRLDAHSRYGTMSSPRASLLAHAAHTFEARLSAGGGFHAPTPFTEETAALPLTRLHPLGGLEAERARNVSLDVTARRGPLEMNATGFVSRIEHAALLIEPDDAADLATASARLVNAAGPTRTSGFEGYAFYDREPIIVTANYSYLDATEVAPGSGVRRDVPLTPRHSAGLDVAWEEDESGTRAGIEIFYTGRQALEHDPYRRTSAPFATVGILVSQRVGRALLYLNGDNLTGIRQTRDEPVRLPHPSPDGRLVVDSWAPAEGRVLNGGVQLRF